MQHTRPTLPLLLCALVSCATSETTPVTTAASGPEEVVYLEDLLSDSTAADAVADSCLSVDDRIGVLRSTPGVERINALPVSNRCDFPLTVHGVQITGDAMQQADEVSSTIPAHGSIELSIAYTSPGEFLALGDLVLRTDDPVMPAFGFGLYGLWKLGADRAVVDFGANAGPDQNAMVGAPAALAGTQTSPAVTSVAWRYKPSNALSAPGTALTGTFATTQAATLTPDVPGHFRAQYVVSDGNDIDYDQVSVFASGTGLNGAPDVIVAGGSMDEITLGDAVSLDASGSTDPDSDPLTFEWELLIAPAGSAATLSSPLTSVATFTPDVPGFYRGRVRVSDGVITVSRSKNINVYDHDIAITEVMAAPFSATGDGEWIEIQNLGADRIGLNGMTLTTNSGSHTFTEDKFIAGGGVGVIAGSSVFATNGRVSPVKGTWSGLSLGDTSDTLSLTTAGGTVLDTVTYTSAYSSGTAAPVGASFSVDPDFAGDNDTATYWCDGRAAFGSGDFGTPGEINQDCDYSFDFEFYFDLDNGDNDGLEDDIIGSATLNFLFDASVRRVNTSNAGTGNYNRTTDSSGQHLQVDFNENGVTYVGSKDFGEDCHPGGQQTNLPAPALSGSWVNLDCL